MTNDECCKVCDRPECTRKIEENRVSGFERNVREGRVKASSSMLEGTTRLLREVADEARRDCEQHKVDWRAVALELREVTQQKPHPNSITGRERIQIHQKLVQAGYDHPDRDFVEIIDRVLGDVKEARVALKRAGVAVAVADRPLDVGIGCLVDDLIRTEAEVEKLKTESKRFQDEVDRLDRVIKGLGEDRVPAGVERAQAHDKLAKDYAELHTRYNALLAEHSDARTMRDVYKVRCEKLQAHAQRPVQWQRTVADVERLAHLYTHDLALPSSTEGEKALGRAVEYLVELVTSGRDVVDVICASYEIHNRDGSRAPSLENWAKTWLGRATATEPLGNTPVPAPTLPDQKEQPKTEQWVPPHLRPDYYGG